MGWLLLLLSWLDLDVSIAAICMVDDTLWNLSAALVCRKTSDAPGGPDVSDAAVRARTSVAVVRLSIERLGLVVERAPRGVVLAGSWVGLQPHPFLC